LIKSEVDKSKFLDRRTFLRLVTLSVATAFIFLWNRVALKQKLLSEKTVISRINTSKLGTGVFLFDTFILVKTASSLKVFSNRCTHAGCRINQETGGQLICPCHGSRYDAATGKVLQGPAILSLPGVPFSSDAKTGEIIVKSAN
jgi:Rieske Fe-S protein